MKTLKEKVSAMIMIGFQGKYPDDPGVKQVISYIKLNKIGGVILYKYNIESPEQLKTLTNSFNEINKNIFIAVDQEGGKVQRLTQEKGFNNYPPAKQVAKGYSVNEAKDLYHKMAKELNLYGINLNFAPIVDLDSTDKPCPVIGKLERSFSSDPSVIVDYAAAFIDAHHDNQVFTSLKHFPGHGLAPADSHKGLVDVTDSFDLKELEPFYHLINMNKVDMIMTAHIINKKLDPNYPATLSSIILKTLLRDKGFSGIIISDDLFMSAIIQYYTLEDSIIRALKATCDIILFSSNKMAYSEAKYFQEPENIPETVTQIIMNAINNGEISKIDIDKAYNRITTLKSKFMLENI